MLYRLKNTDAISVFEMDTNGSVSWLKGDMLVIKDNVPCIIDKHVLSIFLEPMPERASAPSASFVPDPVIPPRPRKSAFGFRRPGVGRSRQTDWIVDGKPPIQVMEGRFLVRLHDASVPGFGPLCYRDFHGSLPIEDMKGASSRLRELTVKGYVEVATIGGMRHVVLTELGRRAVALYGDAMSAAERPKGKKHAKA